MGHENFHRKLTIITAIFACTCIAFLGLYQNIYASADIDTGNNPSIGSVDAKVHMVVFEDLLCYNCRAFSKEVLPEIKKKYIDSGKVRCTFVMLSFMPQSQFPTNALLCVANSTPEKFYPYLQKLHEMATNEAILWQSANLSKIASDVGGIDLEQLDLCMKQKKYYEELQRNLTTARAVMGNNFGTPAVYINGRAVGQLSQASIEKQIDRAL